MTAMGKATESGIRDVAQQVLAPHFHVAGSSEKKVSLTLHCCIMMFHVIHSKFEEATCKLMGN
jgi:hypothetical protein